MTPSLKKRFWKDVTITQNDAGFGIQLDQHQLRTPEKAAFIVPTRALAEMVRDEWDAPKDKVDLSVMHATRITNATIDTIMVNTDTVVDGIAEYGGTDLLCYRADSPAELIARQADVWDPVLTWAAAELNAPLNVTTGVMYVAQPEQSVAHLKSKLLAMTPFQIAAMHDLVAISGSLVLALALVSNHLTFEQAFAASRVDEHWQKEQWGVDDDAEIKEAAKAKEFEFALKFYRAS
ncbi:ATPase [Amylibacter ulvae]|uniref:ATPase n=1 Tax=Paramylibacter ulvae TaxID=1651968 RepID=A0ABQ3D0G8_9RHOB|nr:ATP12 family protein [Amylibacter ulvae]GHA50019.1 ATPase [Amylibacter ulvae]